MTNQQLFDKVFRALKAQGGRSMHKHGKSCAYRGEGGRACAAGVLLADEHYRPMFDAATDMGYGVVVCTAEDRRGSPLEQRRVKALRRALIASGVAEAQLPLVRELQHAHDHTLDGTLLAALNEVARRHGLKERSERGYRVKAR